MKPQEGRLRVPVAGRRGHRRDGPGVQGVRQAAFAHVVQEPGPSAGGHGAGVCVWRGAPSIRATRSSCAPRICAAWTRWTRWRGFCGKSASAGSVEQIHRDQRQQEQEEQRGQQQGSQAALQQAKQGSQLNPKQPSSGAQHPTQRGSTASKNTTTIGNREEACDRDSGAATQGSGPARRRQSQCQRRRA